MSFGNDRRRRELVRALTRRKYNIAEDSRAPSLESGSIHQVRFMAKRISLEEIKRLLEKGKAGTGLLKNVDAFMGLIVFFAPVAVGLPPGTADVIAETLGEREALIKAGERLIERLAKIGTGDEVDRYRRIDPLGLGSNRRSTPRYGFLHAFCG